jgi:hypothetical protein
MSLRLRRILLAIAVTIGLGATGVLAGMSTAHASSQSATAHVVLDDDDDDGKDDDDDDDGGRGGADDDRPQGGVDTGQGGVVRDDDDDDDRPQGGVDTGFGGTVKDGVPVWVPAGLIGFAALAGGSLWFSRRLTSGN